MYKRKYINASEIGTVTFCPKAMYLQKQGIKSSKYNQSHIRRGNIAHEELSKEVIKDSTRPIWIIRLILWIWRKLF